MRIILGVRIVLIMSIILGEKEVLNVGVFGWDCGVCGFGDGRWATGWGVRKLRVQPYPLASRGHPHWCYDINRDIGLSIAPHVTVATAFAFHVAQHRRAQTLITCGAKLYMVNLVFEDPS